MNFSKYILVFVAVLAGLTGFSQQPFTPGNLVVYRVGDGTATLSLTMEKVYLDEYTPSGTLVQSILLPATGKKISMMGSSSTAGLLSLSANGKYLVVPGWDVDAGQTPQSIAGLGRSIALVDVNGDVRSVTSIATNPTSASPAGVTSSDGSGFWLTGGLQLEYVSADGSPTSISALGGIGSGVIISNGQLYAGSNNRNIAIGKIGTGLPTTTGQTYLALPGLPSRTNPQQFALADMDPAIPGPDVLYVASLSATTGGLQKYSFVNGTWVSNGFIGTQADNYVGLTIKINGNVVTLFATRKGANSIFVQGGELVTVTDNSGYNGSFTGTPAVLASVGTADTKAFRGVALVPERAPFTPGNFVAYRLGDGSTTLGSSMAKVYLDEFTPAGTLVQSILMPVTDKKISMLGISNNAGALSLSANGKYLVVPGWDVAKGLAPTTVVGLNRSIGLVDFNSVVNSVTVITNNPSNSQPRGVISSDGKDLWMSGSRIEYVPAGGSTATILANFTTQTNAFAIADGQIYASTANSSTAIMKVGDGLPVSAGQTLTTIPGLADKTNARQFAFADLEPSVPGVDVLYLASTSGVAGGLQKYSLLGGVWVFNGSVGTTADNYNGLTLKIAAKTVTLYASRQGPNSSLIQGGELVTITDNSGYNGTFTGTPSVLLTVPVANTKAYRGLASVPVGCPAVTGLSVPDISATAAGIRWNLPAAAVSGFEYAVSPSITPPTSGTFTTATAASVNGLSDATTYYVHLRVACDATSRSEWTTISFVTGCQPPSTPQVKLTVTALGQLTARWNNVFGAAGYEYNISTSATAPATGVALTDTFVVLPGLQSVTKYYLHVRSGCGGSSYSSWITIPVTTGCFMPALNITVLPGHAGISWTKVPGAVKYEYLLSFTPAKPLSGVFTTDTLYTMGQTKEGTAYHFHVRSICANGSVSEWNTTSFDSYGLKVYPNPVKDVLQVRLEGIGNPSGEISIGDATGRVIKRFRLTGNALTVNTTGWAPGIYLVRYNDGKNKYSVRIVKQ